ncbi:MAG: hypothetical protein ACLQKH_18020 [Steroidobacteraceae bacterium]
MTKPQQAALDRAREHAQHAADHLARARKAHARGDDDGVRRHHDALASSLDKLGTAHDAIGRALVEPDDDDSYVDPTKATGAQGSDGQVQGTSDGRSLDPEIRRRRDQLRSCEIAYRARLDQMGRTR